MTHTKLIRTVSLALFLAMLASMVDSFALRSAAQERALDPKAKTAEAPTDLVTPWSEPVDGMACRLVMQPRFVIGQAIGAVIEIKNASDKKRWLATRLDPAAPQRLSIEITGPKGKVKQTRLEQGVYWLGENAFKAIEPGKIIRLELMDLRDYFGELADWESYPKRQARAVTTGKYAIQFRFRSPKLPDRFIGAKTFINGKEVTHYKDVPAEMKAGAWANEVKSALVSFELAPLAKSDLVVHEWGVFTVFNDVQYANINRREEWGDLPSFFYRQFPQERLRWIPSAWDKPIVYFYTKATPMHVNVKVAFADGAPVVWWPAAVDPVNDAPGGITAKLPRPFRSITWDCWLGERIPYFASRPGNVVVLPAPDNTVTQKAVDFPLPENSWLQHARLPGATQVSVIGNSEGAMRRFPGSLDRVETERFLYYDGLVPAPDYVRCQQIDGKSLTLRNLAKFDLTQLFIVDRRVKDTVGFAFVDGKTQAFKAGASLQIEPDRIAGKDWPSVGIKQVRRALLDAGLFEAEADSLLKIWAKRLLEAEGVSVFHLLPHSEYERMLPLSVLPVPAAAPVRVGIALHPHVEIEPKRAEHVAALIRDLDSTNFKKRDAASKALLEIGPLAISILRAELKKAPSLEVSRHIQAVLERVDASKWLDVPMSGKKNEK